jgi:secreted trypsin-like serine protease
VVPADSVIQITVQGKGVYEGGSVSGTYRILKAGHDISKATIQIANQDYTGDPVTITEQSQFKEGKVYIKIGKDTQVLTLGKDIEVKPGSYVKNVNRGTAKVTFRGIGDFGGTKTVSFKIGARSLSDFWKGIFSK